MEKDEEFKEELKEMIDGVLGLVVEKQNRDTEYTETAERIKTTKKLKKVKTRKAGFRLCLFYSKTRTVSFERIVDEFNLASDLFFTPHNS